MPTVLPSLKTFVEFDLKEINCLQQALASKQAVSATQKEGKICIEGAKYAVSKYLPPPSKMRGVTFH